MAQAEGPPTYQPQIQQQYAPHRPPMDYIRPLASDFLLAIGIILGLFLMMIGSMITGAGNADAADWGNGIKSIGTFIATSLLFLGALVRIDVDRLVRFGFILAAALVIIGVGYWG